MQPEPLRRAVHRVYAVRGRMLRTRKRALRAWWRHYHRIRFGSTYTSTLAQVRTRDQLPELLNRRGLVGVGVEVGVKRGRFSEFLLTHWRGRKLISVDPWREAPDEEYLDRANVEQQRHDAYYEETRRRLARFGARSEIRRETSLEAAAGAPDGSLDFVYVDARHDRESVLEDLEAWWPKLRPGGICSGHDYADGAFPNGVFGVKSAVDHFFGVRGLPVHSTDGGPRAVEIFPTWIVEVPR